MFPNKFHLCNAFGIPVYLDFSLVILLLLFATSGGPFVSSLACALLLLLSITAHELGHALTARTFGYGTRDITLSLLGGCASLIALPRKAWQEFVTAIAGPAVSFALSLLGIVGITILSESGFGDVVGYVLANVLGSFGIHVGFGGGIYGKPSFEMDMLMYLSVMNLMLGIFNLLPGFPLDGGRVFRSSMRAFMPRARATYIAMIVGRVFAVLIGLRGLHAMATGGSWGFVSILIAWMIWREGWREYQMALAEESWGRWDYSARVSPPPYGGDDDEAEVRRR